MIRFAGYAVWAAAAGALIPVMAVLSARLGRVLGDPIQAPVPLFLVGLIVTSIVAFVATGRAPSLQALQDAKTVDLAGGLIVAGYVISVTLIAPRFGIGNVILFAVAAQILTSAAIDQVLQMSTPECAQSSCAQSAETGADQSRSPNGRTCAPS